MGKTKADNIPVDVYIQFVRSLFDNAHMLIIGALSTHWGSQNYFSNRMPAVLWILAVGSYWTFAHRMYHTWHEVKKGDAARLRSAAENSKSASNAGSERRPEPDFARNAGATH